MINVSVNDKVDTNRQVEDHDQGMQLQEHMDKLFCSVHHNNSSRNSFSCYSMNPMLIDPWWPIYFHLKTTIKKTTFTLYGCVVLQISLVPTLIVLWRKRIQLNHYMIRIIYKPPLFIHLVKIQYIFYRLNFEANPPIIQSPNYTL